jgi:DNA-binding LytR/AlgR family response regulator
MKLLCSEQNYKIIKEILRSNVQVKNHPSLAIIENGYDDGLSYDVKIEFGKDKINQLIDFLSLIQTNDSKMESILGMKEDAFKPLDVKTISYFNAINNDVYAHLSNGEEYLVKNKLYQLEELLDRNIFFRINKSEIINMTEISIIKPMFKGKLILYLEGYKNPFDISRNYTKTFKERLGF